MGQNAAKNVDLEAKAQGEDTMRATSCCFTRNETRKTSVHFILCFSSLAKLTEALQGFYAEAQLENVSS